MIRRLILCAGVLASAGSLAAEPSAPAAPNEEGGAYQSDELLITTGSSLELGGPYLVDGRGRALYQIANAPPGRTQCYGTCAEIWPPVLVEGEAPRAAPGAVEAELVGTVQRRDGSIQATYNGQPLYYCREDREANAPTGHQHSDRWGEWLLVSPKGEVFERGEQSESASPSESSSSLVFPEG